MQLRLFLCIPHLLKTNLQGEWFSMFSIKNNCDTVHLCHCRRQTLIASTSSWSDDWWEQGCLATSDYLSNQFNLTNYSTLISVSSIWFAVWSSLSGISPGPYPLKPFLPQGFLGIIVFFFIIYRCAKVWDEGFKQPPKILRQRLSCHIYRCAKISDQLLQIIFMCLLIAASLWGITLVFCDYYSTIHIPRLDVHHIVGSSNYYKFFFSCGQPRFHHISGL